MWRSSAKTRMNASGVVKIRRDTYNTVNGMAKKNGWWEICAQVKKRDKGMCVPCMRAGRATPMKEVHHVVPLSKGGTTTMANLISICENCHNQRHHHLFRSRR